MKIPLPGRSTALSEPILRELLSCCASTLHKDLVNTFDRSCRTTSSASPSDSLVSLQTAPKIFAKEQDAARQTHASPSYGLTAGNGLPKDAVFFFFVGYRGTSHSISSSLSLWKTAHSRCSNRPASHQHPPSATSKDQVRDCLQP